MDLISKVDGNRAELPQGFYDLRHILHFRFHERKQTGITDITIIQSKVGGGTHGHVDQVYQTQFESFSQKDALQYGSGCGGTAKSNRLWIGLIYHNRLLDTFQHIYFTSIKAHCWKYPDIRTSCRRQRASDRELNMRNTSAINNTEKRSREAPSQSAINTPTT